MNRKAIALLTAGTATLFFQAGCKSREESARQELKESGYDLTPEAFFRAAESDDVTALGKLVKDGIAADTRNAAGDTGLHAAAGAGMKKSADFFLDRKIPVDVPGERGRTPLMVAVMKGTPDMVRYLLSQKADPQMKDADGFKPLMLAVREGRADMVGELAAYDREKLDDALLIASLEGKASVIDALTNYGASIYARMDDGRTPLMLAAQNGHIEAVEMLIEIGANRFAMDDQGRIAADMARESGHDELALRLAEEPGQEEFGIEEPADLAAEMLAQVEAAEAAPAPEPGAAASGSNPRLPWNRPVPGQAMGSLPSQPRRPPLLDGAVLESAPAGEYAAAPLVMRAYRQKELPLRVESVQGQTATVRISGAGVQQVEMGGVIAGTPLKVVRMERRMQDIKDRNGRTEVSVVEVEGSGNGSRRELVSGLRATAHDPVALVEDAGGRRYVARAGQHFRAADGAEYAVIDVRPSQMVIENKSTGEVITVPLRGPRG